MKEYIFQCEYCWQNREIWTDKTYHSLQNVWLRKNNTFLFLLYIDLQLFHIQMFELL